MNAVTTSVPPLIDTTGTWRPTPSCTSETRTPAAAIPSSPPRAARPAGTPCRDSGLCLGTAVEAWSDAGRPVTQQAGELVLTEPMPSMPVFFWNDPDGSRYRAAYFDKYPGVWCHGDWITITDRGSVVVQGRSDATLNRMGVRMGSAEIYNAVEGLPEVRDCLVVGVEQDDGYWMPLFVHLSEDVELDEELRARITAAIRTGASPRHVPDAILAVPGIPKTMTGKRLEIPIKRILLGTPPGDAVDRGAVDRPKLLEVFANDARSHY